MPRVPLALVGVFLMSAAAAAAEVTLIEFDRNQKQVTVKEGDAQRVYRLTDTTKYYGVDEDGEAREMTFEDAVKGLGSDKAKGVLKFDLTATEDEVTEARFKARKRK
jgi:opacity protein-like surface antigen